MHVFSVPAVPPLASGGPPGAPAGGCAWARPLLYFDRLKGFCCYLQAIFVVRGVPSTYQSTVSKSEGTCAKTLAKSPP